MIYGKIEPDELVEDRNGEKLGELDQSFETCFPSSYPVRNDDRRLGFDQPGDRLFETLLRRLHGKRSRIALQRRKRDVTVELLFLHLAVVANIDRTHGIGRGQTVGTDERIGHSLHAS